MVKKSLANEFIDEGGIFDDAVKILKVVRNLELIGETGCGKTLLGHALADYFNTPLFEDTLSIDSNRWTFMASDVLEKGDTKVRDGILLKWLKAKKGTALINGFNYAPASVNFFESIADWTNKIYIPELTQEFVRSPEHYLIITMNPYEKAGYCLTEDTLINTSSGSVFIGDLYKDSTVLNKMNSTQKIIEKTIRQYKGNLYHIKPAGIPSIKCSDNHKFLVVERQEHDKYNPEGNNIFEWKISEQKWVEAKDLIKYTPKYPKRHHCVVFPKYKTEIETSMPEDFAWLMGLATAEGSTTSSDNKSFWCLGTHEKDLITKTIEKLKRLSYNPYLITQGSGTRIGVTNKILHTWIRENIGKRAIEKRIPNEIMDSTKAITKQYLMGYLEGDGCFGTHGFQYKTTSLNLAMQLQKLFSKLDIFVSLERVKRPEIVTIRDKSVKQNTIWQGRTSRYYAQRLGIIYPEPKRKLRTRISENDKYFYIPIRGIRTSEFNGILHDIATEDETLQANNIILHNSGTHQMNIATMRRFEPLYLHYLSPMKETDLVMKHYNDYNWVRKLVEFANKTRTLYREGKLTMPLTTGNLKNYAGLKAMDMSDAKIISIASAHYLDEERPTVKRLWEDTEEQKQAKAETK